MSITLETLHFLFAANFAVLFIAWLMSKASLIGGIISDIFGYLFFGLCAAAFAVIFGYDIQNVARCAMGLYAGLNSLFRLHSIFSSK